MYWFMKEEYKIAYEKAKEVLEKVDYKLGEMVSTSKIIDAVEHILKIDIQFTEYNFETLKDANGKTGEFANYGAAMGVIHENGNRIARIMLNQKETDEMKRFSLVHELGHLMTCDNEEALFDGFKISTHIDMDITSISDEILEMDEYKFLIDEQIANIFALLVLMPYDSLLEAFKNCDSIEGISRRFGVEKNAFLSRFQLMNTERE